MLLEVIPFVRSLSQNDFGQTDTSMSGDYAIRAPNESLKITA
jgi:hypothetical protein